MRERLALLREYLKNRLAFGKNKKTRKGFILTMVALVEVLAISVVSVSAWVETISTITFKAVDAQIDNYVYTNADIGSGGDYSNPIELNKYFRAAGGVHLASASSADGKNIFFPIKKSGESNFPVDSYRCADVNDKNVNYIDFSFNVKVDKTFYANHAEFYLDKEPTITIDGEKDSGNLVRMAITDTDTQKTVVCGSEASNKNVVSKVNGDKASEKVKAFSDFVVSPESEPTELFQVKKGSSKTINIKVWLQDDKATTAYAGKTVSISGVNIVAQNKKGNKVYFVDRTVNDAETNWTDNVTFQQGSKDPVQMNFDANSHTYSCNYTPDADETKVKFTSKGVTWTTNMKSLNTDDSMPYTAYGDRNGNVGYGTWGEVIEISVSSQATDVLPDTDNDLSVYMVPNQGDTNSKVRMPFTADKKNWVGYIAKEKADNMTFSFTNNGNTYKIPAPNRGNSTLFVVTSAKTGYWAPPATITVTAGTNGAGTALGEPKVSYDGLTNTTISVTPGTKVKLIANPNKDFALKNWVNSDTGAVADGIGSDGSFTPAASGNYNFTAVYVESLTFEAYVRTYDGKVLSESTTGGSVEIKCGNQNSTVDSKDVTHITLNAVKGSTVTYYAKANDGYVFDGWYTDADCNSVPENLSDKYELANVETSKKLYAKFKVDIYTVKAYAQHGNNPPSGDAGNVSFDNNNYASEVTTTVNRNGEVTFYAKPEKGYAFIGWYATKDAANPKVAVKDCTLNGDVYSTKINIPYSDVKTYELYARFKALYTVEAKAMYNNENVVTAGTVKVGNEKADKISSKPVMEGNDVKVEAIAKKGYKFAGWYTDKACKKPYFKENNNVSPITLNKVSKGITLYAKFESDSTTIYFYNSNDKWTNVYAYMWGDGNNNNKGSDTTFGKPMRHLGGKVWEYSYSSSESWKNVIFSNGSTGTDNQSRDITLQQDKKYFKNDDWQPSSDIKHTVTVSNVENADITVTTGSNTIAEGGSCEVYDGTSLTLNATSIAGGNYCNFIVTKPSGESKTLEGNPSTYLVDGSDITVSATFSSSSSVKTFYFENSLVGWNDVRLYCYKDGKDAVGYDKWPGNELTKCTQKRNNHDVYCIKIDTSKVDYVIFNNKGNGSQSESIKLSKFKENNANGCSFVNNNNNITVNEYFTMP